jgi:DNA-binding NarL/FixJ family response regulator
MTNRTQGLPSPQLLQRLQRTVMSGRDIRALLHDSDFRAIPDRNSQMLFLREFAADQCFVSINDKILAEIYEISLGNVKKIRCNAHRRQQDPSPRLGRPPALTDDQEAEIVQRLIRRASEGIFLKKDELLDEIEDVYGKVLTFGWVHRFLTRHQHETATATVDPQEDPRLQIPR